jgi:glycosyltransferase 2 family protein
LTHLQRAIRVITNNWSWLKWPVALLLLGWLFYANRQSLADLRARSINWFALGAAFILCSAAALSTFYRWYLLVRAQDFPFKFRDALRLGFIGSLLTYAGPGAAGGDLFKAGMIATEQRSRKGIAAATVLLDRMLGLLALFLVGALATFFQDPRLLTHEVVRIYVAWLWAGSIGGVIGLAIVLHPGVPRSRLLGRLIRLPKIGNLIRQLVNAVLLYQSRGRVLIAAVLISIGGHFATLSSFYFCSQAIQAGRAAPGYWANLLLNPGAQLAAVVVPLPGGVGALEAAVERGYAVANEAAGMPVSANEANGAGFMTALAYRVSTIVIAAIGAGYYLTSRGEIRRALRDQRSASPVGEQP